MITKDTALCIRTSDYSETSQIVTFFAAGSGKVDAIAKGSKRLRSAFGGPIEMFSCGTITFVRKQNAGLATLTEFAETEDFTSLSRDLFILNCCLFGSELLNSLTDDHDPHPQLFDSFHKFLRTAKALLDTDYTSRDILVLLILFQLSLLQQIGLQLVLDKCTNCRCGYNHNWPHVYFSSSGNGLICRDCEANFTDKLRISAQSAAHLSNLKSITGADDKIINEIERLLTYHFTEILHHRPRMAKYILKCKTY